MSHFIFPYMGNKRSEFKHILTNLPEINEDTVIIDICCGSGSIAYNLWKLYPNNKYILNDIDLNLYNLYLTIKSGNLMELIEKCNERIRNMKIEELKQMKKLKVFTIEEYIIVSKCVTGTFARLTPINITKKKQDFIKFIQSDNVQILNSDWLDVFKNNNNENSLFLFDPPYPMSCNQYYSDEMKLTSINPYEYFYRNNINSQPSKILFILENIWFIEMLFENNIKYKYNKLYAMTRRKTEHIIITNY